MGAGVLASLAVIACWGIPQYAKASAIGSVSAEAQLTVEAPTASAVDVLAFITDDGTDPFTTFGFVDPDGIAGSGAEAAGTVAVAPGNTVGLNAIAMTVANGAPEPLIEVAYAQTSLSAGFLLINQSASETTDVTISVDWSWVMDLSAAGSPVDLALGQVFLDLLVDGVVTDQLVADFLLAPPDVGTSSGGPFSTVLSLAPSESHEVTLNLLALSLAQSMVPAAVPEPGTLALIVLGAVGAGVGRRRRIPIGAGPSQGL
jgi:hypothetical protein